jgi:Fic family protein
VEVADFKDSPVGQLVPIRVLDRSGVEVDHVAFAPSPLPHDLQLAPLTYKVLTEAALALGRLDQAPARLPAHQYLIRLAVRREAVSTSALEGTFTRFTDVFESDYLDERVLSNSQREVRNYVRAAEWTYRQLECRKLDFALLCEAQALLLRADGYVVSRRSSARPSGQYERHGSSRFRQASVLRTASKLGRNGSMRRTTFL